MSAHEIDIFPSKIYIFNPGKLPPAVDPQKYAEGGRESILKNPRIARVLYLSNSLESFATGFQRAFSGCGEAGIEFSYQNSDIGFSFEFKREVLSQSISNKAPGLLTNIEMKVLELIKKDGYITFEELADKTGKVRRTIDRTISRLKEIGLIERIGSKRDGRWKVIDKQ